MEQGVDLRELFREEKRQQKLMLLWVWCNEANALK